MSRVKDMITERENTIISLIRKVAEITEHLDEDTANEIWDAWYEWGLPYDDEDTAEKFLEGIESDNWSPND